MSEQNHPWCRDVRRDEAVRAAEDAAAVPTIPHRDIPDVVAELRERVARLTTKHNALVDLARLDAGWVKTKEDCLTAERDAAIRERDAARAEVARLEAVIPKSVSGSNAEAHENKGGTMPSEGPRTERVTLEITMLEGGRKYHGDVSSWDWKAILSHGKNFFSFGESVRVVEESETSDGCHRWDRDGERCLKCNDKDWMGGPCSTTDEEYIARLTAERDAAIRERDAARAEAERLRRPATWQEEEAAVEGAWSLCGLEPDWPSDEPGTIVRYAESMRREIARLRDRVAELERAYASECNARAQAHRELSDLADAIRNRESGEECDHSYAAQCRDASVARERADGMISAPAANAGGVARQEDAIYRAGQFAASEAQKGPNCTERESGLLDRLTAERDAAIRERDQQIVALKSRLAYLESAPAANAGGEARPEPRGWLTAREREEVQWAADAAYDKQHPAEDTLRALLARSTPPKVKVPEAAFVMFDGESQTAVRDRMWIAAIRAAGGEVEE